MHEDNFRDKQKIELNYSNEYKLNLKCNIKNSMEKKLLMRAFR